MTSWLILVVAGLFESAWAIGMKYTHGFTRLWPSVFVLASLAVSMYLLSVAVKSLSIGTAYAVWTGIGAVSTAILGIVLFHEPATVARIVCILLIVSGICGLVLLDRSADHDLGNGCRHVGLAEDVKSHNMREVGAIQ